MKEYIKNIKKYEGNMKEYMENMKEIWGKKFRAFQQKGGEILRGHNSWDGPQYQKGRRVFRQNQLCYYARDGKSK